MLLRHVYRLRAYDFFFKLLNKIVETKALVNPYESRTAAACFRIREPSDKTAIVSSASEWSGRVVMKLGNISAGAF